MLTQRSGSRTEISVRARAFRFRGSDAYDHAELRWARADVPLRLRVDGYECAHGRGCVHARAGAHVSRRRVSADAHARADARDHAHGYVRVRVP